MCGRFSLHVNRREIQALEGNNVDVDAWEGEDDFQPRYNVAPRTQVPVVRRRDAGGSQQDVSLVMQTMKWGLVPHWSKVEDKTLNTINARAESIVNNSGMWNSIKGSNRCAVPCQGYYEWLTKGKEKIPHFLKRKDGRLLLMAGLYDLAVIDGQTLWTFTIVTTEANKEFSWLHDRQPVFLTSKDALDKWLDTRYPYWTENLTKLVTQPYHDDSVHLECYPVPQEVGKVGSDSPTFIEPVATRKDGIQALFAKQTSPNASPVNAKRARSITPIKLTKSDQGTSPPSSSQPVASPPVTPRRPKQARRSSPTKYEEEPRLEEDKSARKKTEFPQTKKEPTSPVKSRPKSSASSPKKSPNKAEGSAKITTFFGRK